MHRHVFQYTSYVKFLAAELQANHHIRGYQSRMAEAAGCQRSYFSQILKEKIPITIEQAYGLAAYLELTPEETDYFLTLAQIQRAGTVALKKYFETQAERLRSASRSITKQMNSRQLPAEVMQEYYANWYWMAIHVLVAIPGFDSAKKIASHLNLTEDLVNRSLSKLVSWGVVVPNKKGWSVAAYDLHLSDASPLTQINHSNWRTRAKVDIDKQCDQSLHYTAVFALSKQDADAIRTEFLMRLVELRKQIQPSPSEEAYALTLDWFPV